MHPYSSVKKALILVTGSALWWDDLSLFSCDSLAPFINSCVLAPKAQPPCQALQCVREREHKVYGIKLRNTGAGNETELEHGHKGIQQAWWALNPQWTTAEKHISWLGTSDPRKQLPSPMNSALLTLPLHTQHFHWVDKCFIFSWLVANMQHHLLKCILSPFLHVRWGSTGWDQQAEISQTVHCSSNQAH